MDINWYASEKIVEETLRAQRAKAASARLAVAPPYGVCRRVATVLIKVADTITHGFERNVGRSPSWVVNLPRRHVVLDTLPNLAATDWKKSSSRQITPMG
jgi:hypothetical protein